MSTEEEAVERGTRMLMAWFLHEDHELTCRDLVEELFAIARAQSPTERAIRGIVRDALAETVARSVDDVPACMAAEERIVVAFLGEFGNTPTRDGADE